MTFTQYGLRDFEVHRENNMGHDGRAIKGQIPVWRQVVFGDLASATRSGSL
jgi:hypothetical protein